MSLARFIADQRTEHGVPHTVACRALGRSTSWLYKWLDRAPTPRQRRRAELAERIRKSFVDSGRTYGSPRVVLDLRADGQRVSVNTVAKVMRLECLVARPCRRRHGLTRQGKRPAAPDLVRRTFNTVAPNVLWTGDLTEIGTGEGTLYLACVLDMFSRNALGHAFSAHHDADLAVAALQQAAARRGGPADGVIFHTDRGSEYTAQAFAAACARLGVTQSMGRTGSALDNAVSEAFHSTIKVEYIYRHQFATRTEAIEKISAWLDGFYNLRRRHSANNGMSPVDFEEYMAEVRKPSIT
jgi:transposase InsO family protein